MIKAVTFFLIAIIALGLFGRLKFPQLPRKRSKPKIADARKCPSCGAYVVGDGPCPCGKDT